MQTQQMNDAIYFNLRDANPEIYLEITQKLNLFLDFELHRQYFILFFDSVFAFKFFLKNAKLM